MDAADTCSFVRIWKTEKTDGSTINREAFMNRTKRDRCSEDG